MRRLHSVLAAASLGAGLVIGATGVGLAGSNEEAPAPRCERHPGVADQGDDVVLRGQRWSPDSTVTITFDGQSLSDEDTNDSTTTDDTTVDVNSRGRFRTVITIPDDAFRGVHSINLTGLDRDDIDATCALLEGVPGQPSTGTDTSGTTEDTNDTTGTTDGSTPSTSTTTSTTSP